MTVQTTIYWNDAKKTQPAKMQTILVIYEEVIWPGVYANGKVTLYPEDFGSVQISECDLWAALPQVPQPYSKHFCTYPVTF